MGSRFLICVQCENMFEFTPSEQDIYRQRGFDDPRRCPACRKHKIRQADDDFTRRGGKKRDYRSKYDTY